MRIELGATVRTADEEEVGTVDQLVVDANKREVAAFILHTGRFHTHDHVVPIDTIARVDEANIIHLRLTAAQLQAMPEFESRNFVVAEHPAETAWRYLIPANQAGEIVLPGPSTASAGGFRAYSPACDTLFGAEDPTDETVVTWSSLPEWDYRVGKGTKVVTRDGHTVGTLHEVEIDADGKPTGIIVASGRIHHGHHSIPAKRIRSASAEQILLTVTKDAYEAMAAPVERGR